MNLNGRNKGGTRRFIAYFKKPGAIATANKEIMGDNNIRMGVIMVIIGKKYRPRFSSEMR